MRRAPLLFLAALAGCGLGPGKQHDTPVSLRVTRDFGKREIASVRVAKLPAEETVMRLLTSRQKVTTSYGGRFVDSIGGVASTARGGRSDWFFFVNGIESPEGAADRDVEKGDVIQWDYRRWDGAMRVPAVVGGYPEPFKHGTGGKKFPVRVECAGAGGSCNEVKGHLRDQGVIASEGEFGVAGGEKLVRVLVGPWSKIGGAKAAESLDAGPGRSGVFARFGGDQLQLLDERGRLARVAPAGTGLVAATRLEGQSLVWLVTGVDEAGVRRAAAALSPVELRDAFAVAATPSGIQKLPLR